MHIIGTAGHVDHGKSSLVIALTGINPDRLIEEQRRGMTLDLGFAPLHLDGVEAGIIDVPGHERFLHNMLAGAAGMELLLLVIDAAEGPRAQTFDHLRILDLLNVRRAIIVLTKRDIVDAEALEIAAELAKDAVAGTVARDAAVIAVSNVTGEGIVELKAAIREALASLPARDADAPAYMPVDRVFALPGHGTIVTGTLMQGTLRTGDALVLQPSGIEVRARSIQTFGSKVDEARGGARVAVNLPGVAVGAIKRGEALVAPREFAPSAELVIDFTALPSATGLLKRRTHVRAHVGSDEIPGVLAFEESVPSGASSARARLRLQRPTVAYPGLRLVLRRMSPKDLLGGAIVLSALARSALADGPSSPLDERALQAVKAAALAAVAPDQLAAALNVVLDKANATADALVTRGDLIQLHKPDAYVAREAADAAFAMLSSALDEKRRRAPWLLGATAADVARTLALSEALARRLLAAWHEDGRLALTGRFWHAPDSAPAFSAQQRDFFARELHDDPANPLLPVSYEALLKRVESARVDGLKDALETLLVTGALVRVGDDLYRRAQITRARTILATALSAGASATMAQLRDAFGTSRRYALPLMEYFDGIGVTIRDGDLRRLRVRAPAVSKG
ncbi:MAG: selenocysteine-specific translation elongation factor [Candidatus Eremiobacteraeota bacterium]|nr:selenocysteine-specific translation elongation factor [Candidatus Eremiobacteraeota bacterium]